MGILKVAFCISDEASGNLINERTTYPLATASLPHNLKLDTF